MKRLALIVAVAASFFVPTEAEAACCGSRGGRVRAALVKIVEVVRPGRASACSAGPSTAARGCANGTCTAK